MQLHQSSYQPPPWPVETVYLKIPQKCRLQSIEPTHLHRQVENATAPSAGNSPDPDGKSLPQRAQRAQRSIGRGDAAPSEQLSTTALAC